MIFVTNLNRFTFLISLAHLYYHVQIKPKSYCELLSFPTVTGGTAACLSHESALPECIGAMSHLR